jgi:hypothetical protein
MLRALAGGCIVLAVAGVVVLLLSLRVPLGEKLATTVRAETCAPSPARGVDGALPGNHGLPARYIVQILPAVPYGAFYLDQVRERMGLPTRAEVALSPEQTRRFAAVLRYASIDPRGHFICGRLAAGTYIAVATTALPSGVSVDVARFAVPAGRSVTLPRDRFRPLQEIQ